MGFIKKILSFLFRGKIQFKEMTKEEADNVLGRTKYNAVRDKVNKGFKFSKSSKARLKGVDNRLVRLTEKALKKSPWDFAIVEGLRSFDRQLELYKQGKSKIKKTGPHTEGRALDIVAYNEHGQRTYKPFDLYIDIAQAFHEASKDFIYDTYYFRWGGAWVNKLGKHMKLHEFPNNSAYDAFNEYLDYKKGKGQVPFLDALHFEIIRGKS